MNQIKLRYLATIFLGAAAGIVIGSTLFKGVPIFLAVKPQQMGFGHPRSAPHVAPQTAAAPDPEPEEEARKSEERIQAYRNDPLNYTSFLNSKGEVSLTILTAAGMSASAGVKVMKIYNDTADTARKDLSSRITKDLEKTDDAKGIYAYNIRGNPEKSDTYTSLIEKNFMREFGGEAALVLMKALNGQLPLADFGRYDLEVTVNKNISPDSGDYIFVRTFDVNTGFKYREQSSSLEYARNRYGSLFDFVENR